MSFEVVVCRDKIQVPYHHFTINKDTNTLDVDPQTLIDLITYRYNDRVFPPYGLFIDVLDIVRAFEVKAIHNCNTPFVDIIFRYIVFNPKIGSVWIGVIDRCDSDGVYLYMGFFKDVFVPCQYLPERTEFDKENCKWFWSDPATESYLDFSPDDVVKFKVCSIKYRSKNEDNEPIMQIIGDMSSNGLGNVAWWTPGDDEEDLEDGEHNIARKNYKEYEEKQKSDD